MLMNCRPPELVDCRPPKKLQLDSLGLRIGVVLVVSGSFGSGPLGFEPTKYAQIHFWIGVGAVEAPPSNSQSNVALPWAFVISGHASSVPAGRTVTGAGSVFSFRFASDSALTTKRAVGTFGVTVSVVVWLPLSVAVMVTEVEAPTAVVLTAKEALVAPPLTVTEPGTVAAGLLLDNPTLTAVEDVGLTVTDPCEAVPPTTLFGLTLTLVTEGGVIPGPLPLSSSPPQPNANKAGNNTKAAMAGQRVERA
jgi:hypothetical protein